VSVKSVHNLHYTSFSNAKRSREGRPRMVNRTREWTNLLEIGKRRLDITTNAIRYVQQVLGMAINSQIVMRILIKVDLRHRQRQRSHISSRNVKACLEFAKIHQHLSPINDLSWVIFLNGSKINQFGLDKLAWCWTQDTNELLAQPISQIINLNSKEIMF
jgi:hypothetical protein